MGRRAQPTKEQEGDQRGCKAGTGGDKSAQDTALDEKELNSKGFLAFQAVMAGYFARKKVKEQYNFESALKKKQYGVQQFLNAKHGKHDEKARADHDLSSMVQTRIRK